MHALIVQKVSHFFLFSVTETETFDVATDSVIHKKVLFGTTVSISKNGTLASCSNLEWTSTTSNVVLAYGQIQIYDFGKCYTKDISKNSKFSFLLENGGVMKIFNPQFPVKNGKKYFKNLLYLFQ